MHRKIIIRRLLAFTLLAIFALSTMPTKFLHQLFANHTDFVTQITTKSESPQLNVSGIDCHCNSLVVIAPYICGNESLTQKILPLFIDHTITSIPRIFFTQLFFFELRGPPVAA